MSVTVRQSIPVLLALSLTLGIGCNMVPQQTLRQSQVRAVQLAGQNRQLSRDNMALKSNLDVSNQRLANLNNERTLLQQRYVNLLKQQSPLSPEATRQLEALKKKYPLFQFDPKNGVSRIGVDILFNSGSDVVNKKTAPEILGEFARIMNQGDAKHLNILVVGHTDDRRIARANTRSKHATNWHLSTNRANAVLMSLQKLGIESSRLGVAGYGPNQPLVPNSDDAARQKNRRVEIFVLHSDAVVARWNPETSRQ
ncbi:MAG TPA: flagellar motor protein MotB [Planctomycetaceae bacterium]|nr:flagellar motor protein MotB [Planctomycetaceae bacterium]HAA48143.1 flagellar motor protein MotB [Planctomycetaceae bacterium]|tara:strand:+ start:23 stop:784 length:762 start_codon:yes stop_codon:yes gene_type:complete